MNPYQLDLCSLNVLAFDQFGEFVTNFITKYVSHLLKTQLEGAKTPWPGAWPLDPTPDPHYRLALRACHGRVPPTFANGFSPQIQNWRAAYALKWTSLLLQQLRNQDRNCLGTAIAEPVPGVKPQSCSANKFIQWRYIRSKTEGSCMGKHTEMVGASTNKTELDYR